MPAPWCHHRAVTAVLGLGLTMLTTAFMAPSAHADSIDLGACASAADAQSTVASTPPGSYRLYAKRPSGSNIAARSLRIAAYQILPSGGVACQTYQLGPGATDDAWEPVGVFLARDTISTTFAVEGAGTASDQSADRMRLMTIPDTVSCTTLSDYCYTVFQTKPARITPVMTELASGQIVIERIADTSTDRVVRADYYADGSLLYSRNTAEPFTGAEIKAYTSGSLSRVITFASGQKLIVQESLSITQYPGFITFIRQLVTPYSELLAPLYTGLAAITAFALVRRVIAALRARHTWLRAHGLEQSTRHTGWLWRQGYRLHDIFSTPTAKALVVFGERLAVIGLVALIVIGTVIEPFQVSGHSMDKTLHDGQHLVAYKLSAQFAKLSNQLFIPRRGDIVIIDVNAAGSANAGSYGAGKTTIVKRVIGLPGERVVVVDGAVAIYNQAHPTGFNPDAHAEWAATRIPDTRKLQVDITLADDELFIMGDNRPGSIDSTINGPVDTRLVIGTVIARY